MKREMKYERVPVYDDWIKGKIDKIEYDEEHKRMWKGEEKVGPAVRITLDLEGCQYPKKSPWMSFTYTEKSNLYKTYIVGLVENPQPNMDFDLDALQGLPIKAMYVQNGEYDNLQMIRPLKAKVPNDAVPESAEEETDEKLPY